MLKILGLSAALILLVILVAAIMAVRSHRHWLTQQTPVGVWTRLSADGEETLLEFEGGPAEGTYRELRVRGGRRHRELGHWAGYGNELRMLIMATDRSDHPRFGKDDTYQVSYTGPSQISITGPDRESWVLERAPLGVKIDMETFQAPTENAR